MAEPTPAAQSGLPGRFATEADILDLNALALIGTFGAPDGRGALVRLPSGRVRRVAAGDRLRGAVVERVEAERLLLRRQGGLTELRLPGAG